MSTSFSEKQSGAVTLIGALFIIITLAFMGVAINQMAASSITDTIAQNDAVEALFVAETGIEYASYLYANGASNCVNLKTNIGSINSGRGNFNITASAINGTDCSITVRASVSSAGTGTPDASLRIINADLRLSSDEIWAVGNGGTIIRWDGANWTASISGTPESLNGIHCATANDCWAVGEAGTIRYWDGSSWNGQASSTNSTLYSVSCDPNNRNYCFASGGEIFFSSPFFTISAGVIQAWDGTVWSDSENIVNFGDWRFLDLSCPSLTCYVATANGVIWKYTGNWLNDNSGTGISMNSIDCTSDEDCWSVGDNSGNNWNVNERNASGWNPQLAFAGNRANQNLNTVSCIDANDCWAAGNRDGNRYVFGHWNGTSWSVQNNGNNGTQREDINGIHCIATDDCWAVGNARNGWNILHYNGTNWIHTGATAPNPVDLQDVFIVSGGGGGSVNLVRWQEQISN